MLGTIKLPKNMKLISGNLPESNYESDRPKKSKNDERSQIRGNADSVLDEIVEDKEEDQENLASGLQSANRRNYR